MKKHAFKTFSDDEIIEFYNKYTNKDFQTKIQNIEDKYAKLGITSIKIFLILGVICVLLSPWFIFLFLPGFVIPTSTLFLSHNKIRKEINKLSPTIKYDDFICLVENNSFERLKQKNETFNHTTKNSVEKPKNSQIENYLEDEHNLNL